MTDKKPASPHPIETAMNRAFRLGEIHWQHADSDFISHHKKADEMLEKFEQLKRETVDAALAQPAAQGEATAYCQPDDPCNSTAFSWSGTERKASHTISLYTHPPQQQGEVVVTTAPDGRCVAVTRQDDEGRILSVIWEAKSQQQPRSSIKRLDVFAHDDADGKVVTSEVEAPDDGRYVLFEDVAELLRQQARVAVTDEVVASFVERAAGILTVHDRLQAANARIAELTAAVTQYQQHGVSWANDLDAANQALIPDQELCRFYQVTSYAGLVAAQQKHIAKLQERIRNIEPKADFRVRVPREG